jgi:putative transposase
MSWQDIGRALLIAFVVMPDHLHVLAVLLGEQSLEESFGRWKRWCTREINRRIGRQGAIWQPGFFDRRVRREEDVAAIGRYIELNPVRRELVTEAEEFTYSSANPALLARMLGRPWLAGEEKLPDMVGVETGSTG